MAKRKRRLTAQVMMRREKTGRGKGRGVMYQPMLNIHDAASFGRSHRVWLPKTGRIHHSFSDLETRFLYVLHWSERVVDIREQYPLELSETLTIAEVTGIKHPMVPRTQESTVMTTDFVITVQTGMQTQEYARSIKYSADLARRRVIEKLEIERLYWERRKIDWGISTEHDIPKMLAENIAFVMNYYDLTQRGISQATLLKVAPVLTEAVLKHRDTLYQIATHIDAMLNLLAGTALAIVYHLIATRQWQVDLTHPLDTNQPLTLSNTLTEEVLTCSH